MPEQQPGHGMHAIPSSVAETVREYRRSLKAVEMEETFDLVLYRPIAFVFVKVLRHTPVTPNQVSVASLACGLAAGWLFSLGTPSTFAYAALAYFACNTLDCADGQLARLRGGGSPFGYLVDGCIDYVAGIAVFVGIAVGLEAQRPGEASWWLLAASAGCSCAWQCGIVDRQRKAWSHAVLGARDAEEESRMFHEHLVRYRQEGGHYLDRFMISAYLGYHALWRRLTPRRRVWVALSAGEASWAELTRPAMRMATWMGPTMQMSLIMLSGLANRPDLYLWATLTLGNVYALLVMIAQRRAALACERAGLRRL